MGTKNNSLPSRKKKKENWTPEIVQQFRRDYPNHTDDELCKMYETNHLKVQQLQVDYCLGKNKRTLPGVVTMPRWTDDQLKTLKEMYTDNDNIIIAKKLGKTVKSVVSKAFFLGLKKSKTQLTKIAKKNVACRSAVRKVKVAKARKAKAESKKKKKTTKK